VRSQAVASAHRAHPVSSSRDQQLPASSSPVQYVDPTTDCAPTLRRAAAQSLAVEQQHCGAGGGMRAVTPPRYGTGGRAPLVPTLSPASPAGGGGSVGRRKGGVTAGRSPREGPPNKPIMLYLHPNVPEYEAKGTPLLVNLAALSGFHELLDDCTMLLKMQQFAGKLFTPTGDQIESIAAIQPKDHVIVVGEKEHFKVRTMAVDEDDEAVEEQVPAEPAAVGPATAQEEWVERWDAGGEVGPATAQVDGEEHQQALLTVHASAAFARFDADCDGVLNFDEVTAMMTSLGYKVERGYVEGILDNFGNGEAVSGEDFPGLWQHFGGEVEGEAPDVGAPAVEVRPFYIEFGCHTFHWLTPRRRGRCQRVWRRCTRSSSSTTSTSAAHCRSTRSPR
jgi:hypothetical protein